MPAQNLNSLNGVVFTAAEHGVSRSGATYADGAFNISGVYGEGSSATYTFAVLNSDYTPATGNKVATFGEIEETRKAGASVHHYYYHVIGFASDGVLLGPAGSAASPGSVSLLGDYLNSGTEIFATVSSSSPDFPLTFTQTNDFVAPCYAEGTRILTARGAVAVEDLVEGDEAVTASGATRPVIWIGSRRVRCDIHPNPAEVNPVRIRKGAFGEGLPERDLVLSPGHAAFMDGVLIPAHSLINGATIVQEQVEQVRYFHVELDVHDVILAEGLACESYLDDGNRTTFGNSPDFTALHGRLDPKSWENACAPVAAGAQLAEVRRRLLGRAEEMGWTRAEEPGLHILADGVAVAPLMAKENRYWFALPAARELKLVSKAAFLAHTLPGVTDPRRLGVAIGELKLDGRALDLDASAFGPGFHAVETHGETSWRWTDGEAALRLPLETPAMLEAALLMIAPAWIRPAANLCLVQVG
jgi:hypothetical protein